MTFTEYCKQNNIELLPDDLRFIRKMIKNISKGSAAILMRKYVEFWIKGMDEESDIVKKQSKGRYKANSWLREML